MISRKFVLLAACLCTLCVFLNEASAEDLRIRKKLIETSGLLNTIRLRQNLEVMEQQPFDGVVLDADGHNAEEQKFISLRPAFTNEEWQREWFQNCVDDLKACKFNRFTDNFVLIGANPGDVDWFDDAGWANITEHW